MNKLALLLLVGCSSSSTGLSTAQQKSLLTDRNWMDRMPETKHDRLHVYRFVPDMGGGVFQDRTVFKGTFELFRFEAQNGKIRFDLPETDEKITSAFEITEVKQPPFDLKLTISDDPRGPHVYFGMRNEISADLSTLLP